MTEQRSAGGLDFEALRRAREQRDADLLLSLYADDAEVRVVDQATPPGSPKVLRGEEAAEYWRDVCGRDMTHRVENEVIGAERVAFNEACEYPDGTKVLSAETLDVHDGKIVNQTVVQAWDE
jgi:ketosteroid isomerase-like protein